MLMKRGGLRLTLLDFGGLWIKASACMQGLQQLAVMD